MFVIYLDIYCSIDGTLDDDEVSLDEKLQDADRHDEDETNKARRVYSLSIFHWNVEVYMMNKNIVFVTSGRVNCH